MRQRRDIIAVLVALGAGGWTSLNAEPLATAASKGSYTAAQADRGRAIYQARCATCHGGALAGEDTNPPLAGGRFLANWTGQSLGTLATRIRTTMPLDEPNALGLLQTADVTAYLLQANGFRAGSGELSPDPAQLRQILIDPPDRVD